MLPCVSVICLVFLVASKRDTSELKVQLIFSLLVMSYVEVCNNADPLPNFVRIYIYRAIKKSASGR